MRLAVRGVFWVVLYLAVVIAPLIFAWIGPEAGRGFVINLSVALGFVGLAMMGLQFALVARFRAVSAPFGMDLLLQFHRQMAYVALAFILAHPVLLFVYEPGKFLPLLDVFTSPPRAKFAVLSTAALLALVALSVWRKRLRIGYELWQLTHGVLGVVIIAAALAHVFLVNYYVEERWERALWIFMSGGFVLLLIWVRIVKPILRYGDSWRIQEVRPERGDVYTLALTPTERHRGGFAFEPGQFAWIMVGGSPFAVTQHPFSISSSAEDGDRIELSIKAAGDFTSAMGSLQPGTTVYLDGPYGAFTPDRNEGPGFVFVGAGVGITPLMCMLRTLADREDERPCYLFLGNRDQESITFGEEIEALKARLNLEVVHVLSHPEAGWKGETGHLDADLLARHLPKRYERMQYFICGPERMMDATEKALTGKLGVPGDRVHSERFGMV